MWKILNKKIKKNRKTKWIEEISDLHITGLNPTLPIKSESCASTFKKNILDVSKHNFQSTQLDETK